MCCAASRSSTAAPPRRVDPRLNNAMTGPLPQSMRYIDMAGPGGSEVLTLATGPVPPPGPGEVLIRVAAAGVNRPDVLQRAGSYPPPPGASPVLGLEVSGMIAALGDGVDEWQVDDEVCALVPGGGYAQ